MHTVGPQDLQDAIRTAIMEIDLDGDGQICTAELEKYVESHEGIHNHGLIVQMMKTLDVDGDGKISSQELAVLAI